MSNIKLIKNLTIKESQDVCDNSGGCAECPLLISSYNKNIHCLRDDEIKAYEIEKAYNILNSKIDLDTNKLEEDKQ